MVRFKLRQKGFTLIEILLVIALIAILAGIVIFAINIPKQLVDARNTQRRSDVNTIISAVYQYAIDNGGQLPDTINTSSDCTAAVSGGTDQICSQTTGCDGLTDLSVLTSNQKYLTSIPEDPGNTDRNSGYFIFANANNRVTVCAPNAEDGAVIQVTR